MPKAYNPREVEGRLYQFWMEGGYFTPKIDPEKKPFVIIMPPPNVTGELHLGHALTATLEDIMIRWHRMRGDPTLWLPGVDHAGIAGQNVVEQLLAAEGLSRHELGRERFLERMWDWMNRYRGVIGEQHQRLGASCDWGRERFTMDEGPSRAVRQSFVNLYRKGLIYRGERIINWCPRCTTAISDLEVEHEDTLGYLYYVRYPLLAEGNGREEYIEVATTRPETILGDTAVAVHPQDERHKGLLGRKAILPVLGRIIPIIADEAVDPGFGTGAVKVTPAHDPVDFEVGERHRLPSVRVMNPDGTMNQEAGPFTGMDRLACREAILKRLVEDGLLVRQEDHIISLGHCERCKSVIEPLVSQQWFVRIKPLAQPAIEAVLDGRVRIIPERFTKVYLNWMENIRDWCISRQLWWGHRIPVWYCSHCQEVTVATEDPEACAHCGSREIVQDPDVLDTWFSSALWPHSTLGWPQDTQDFRYFYPTSVMETGYDILFFWVARMIMMGLENTGQVPFSIVYLHGLVRDERGEKMSKSKGNVLNPVDAMDTYGTDALRFALSTGSTPGNDLKLSKQKLEAGRNFANKLWNAARFVVNTKETAGKVGKIPMRYTSLPLADRWILSRLNRLIVGANQFMEAFQFGEAESQIQDFIWGEFCDWYIEISKIRLRQHGEPSPLPLLVHILETSLRLLHPFLPFITEEIWQTLIPPEGRMGGAASVMVAPYPEPEEGALDIKAEWQMELVINLIRSVRNARAEFRVEPAHWIEAIVVAGEAKELVEAQSRIICSLARVRNLHLYDSLTEKPREAASAVVDGVEVYLPLGGLLNLEGERRRLQREISASQAKIDSAQARLADAAFLDKAPPTIVEREYGRLRRYQEKQAKLKERLLGLESKPG